jgi:hypothetical protein
MLGTSRRGGRRRRRAPGQGIQTTLDGTTLNEAEGVRKAHAKGASPVKARGRGRPRGRTSKGNESSRGLHSLVSKCQVLLKFTCKADNEAWSDLQRLESSDQVTADHISSVYRQNPAKHHLCPCNYDFLKASSSSQVHELSDGDLTLIHEHAGEIAPFSNCRKVHCRLNPNCLNYLGIEDWASQGKDSFEI